MLVVQPRAFLSVVLWIKNEIIFQNCQNWIFYPCTWGLKKGTLSYKLKNENIPRGLFNSLNEVFWCTDYNTKNLSSLWGHILEKSEKKHQKGPFFINVNVGGFS